MNPVRTPRHDPVAARAVAEHGADIVAAFRAVQAERGHLSAEAIGTVAELLGVPAERAFGVASFYSMLSTRPRPRRIVRVCDGPACQLEGGASVRAAVDGASGRNWAVERSSCLGLCDRAPAALVDDAPCGPLSPARAGEALRGWRGAHPTYGEPLPGETRVTLARIGGVDPDSIDSALAAGAYGALETALRARPSDVTDLVEAAGLQGRPGTVRSARRPARESRSSPYSATSGGPASSRRRTASRCGRSSINSGAGCAAAHRSRWR
jgi:NADH:ubiquinone oxidoreductase subunit E